MTLNTYRMKIVSHLFTMVETLHQVSSEIHIPRVTFNADIIGTIRNINDAITHISSEAKIPDVPENTTEIDIVVTAVNNFILAINGLSSLKLDLKPIPLKGN